VSVAPDTRRIVVGVDESDGAADALRWAEQEADLDGAVLTAVLAWGWLDQHHLLDPSQWDPEYGAAEAHAALSRYVEMALGPDALERVRCTVVAHLPIPALVDAAREADLLVVGARGLGGFKGLLLGSVSQGCLHRATTPVAVIHDGPLDIEPRRVVAAVDGSAQSVAAARWAADAARRRGARLDVLHTWQLPYLGYSPATAALFDEEAIGSDAQATISKVLGEIDTSGVEVNPVALRRATVAGIIEHARGAAVLVLGSRGLGAVQRTVFGSVATQVSYHAPCPLVVVPSQA
jgi:nucleotide-binding universal stress UspA family protein